MRFFLALAVAGGLISTAACTAPVPVPTYQTSTAAAPTAGRTSTPISTPATPTPEPTTEPVTAPAPAVDTVLGMQRRLSDLGYWLGEPDGNRGNLTGQAVLAFQKAEGLTRDGVAGPRTLDLLADATRPVPRSTAGDLIEVDVKRQLLLVVHDGEVRWALNTSTGNGETYAASTGGTAVAATPRGEFRIERQIDGLRHAPLGTLYRPKYFVGGIAIHGSRSVPAQPASHGCVRLTNAAMDLLWDSGVAEVGTRVLVY